MNQRVIAFVIVGAAAVGAALFLLTWSRSSTPVDDTAVTRPAEAPRPAARSAAPAPTPAPSPERPRATEPRPRAAAPRAEAAPAPAAAAPAADLVTLRVDSDVPGANVFVDRNFVGKTPLTTTDIKPGSHQINVSAPGHEGVAQRVDLEPGSRDVMIKLREVRLNAAIDVIHKHRMGNCKGRLIATPAGLRYETTDKDDAFRVGLLELEEFAVDYLEKNLRVRTKNKRFDFTDPEGNADHLFVFHRDVDKARERIRKGDTPAAE